MLDQDIVHVHVRADLLCCIPLPNCSLSDVKAAHACKQTFQNAEMEQKQW